MIFVLFFFSLSITLSLNLQTANAAFVNETNTSWVDNTLGSGTFGSNETSQIGEGLFSVGFSTNVTAAAEEADGAGTQSAETSYEEELKELEDPQTIIDIINADSDLQDAIKTAFNLVDLTDADIESIAETTAEVVKSLTSSRDYSYAEGKTSLTLTFTYSGEKEVENFLIYDNVPKIFADDADKITVTAPGAVVSVIIRDPVFSFFYETLEQADSKTIEYKVIGKVDVGVLDEISVPTFIAKRFEGAPPLPSEIEEEEIAEKLAWSYYLIIILVIIAVVLYLRRGIKK